MAKPRMDLPAFVGKLLEEQDGDVLREGIRVLSQALMETRGRRPDRRRAARAHRRADGVSQWEPDADLGHADGHDRAGDPEGPAGDLLSVAAAAAPARRACAAGRRAGGVRARRLDAQGRRPGASALGVDGISKSEVSRICGELDTTVAAFRTRPLTGEHRYLWVDATYHKVRVDGRVISQATVVAVGVTSDGERQVLGVDVGPSEDQAFWTAFLREPGEARPAGRAPGDLRRARGPQAGDQHGADAARPGSAVGCTSCGTCWRRCRRARARPSRPIVRTIFAQPDHASALVQLRKVAEGLRARFARDGRAAGGRGRRHPGLSASAARAPAATAQHQPARTARTRRSSAASQRRRDLSQSGGGDPAGWRDPARAGRRMGRRRAALLQRGVDAAADDADAVEHGAGDPGGDRVTEEPGWALWETREGFPSGGGRRSRVHGRGSVHADQLTDDADGFPPLDGTLPSGLRARSRSRVRAARRARVHLAASELLARRYGW